MGNDFIRLDEDSIAHMTSYLKAMPQAIPKAIAKVWFPTSPNMIFPE